MVVVDMLDRILDSLSEALMHKISVLPSPAANSMYIRMCICMCLSYSPNKGGTTKPRYLAPAANSSYSRIARRQGT